MNLTSDFVFVHMPKTGGTFVSSTIGKLYDRLYYPQRSKLGRLFWGAKRLSSQVLNLELSHVEFNEHGTCREIPIEYQNHPILSCVRHPFDWYVSNYKFAYWKSHPDEHPGLLQADSWPELTFDNYLHLSNTKWFAKYNPHIDVNRGVGRLSVLFINFYCKNPDAVLASTDSNLTERVANDLFDVSFLHTHRLNDELFEYLSQFHTPEKLEFIRTKPKISPRNQRRAEETWDKFFSDAQKSEMYERDKVLFDLFPKFREMG